MCIILTLSLLWVKVVPLALVFVPPFPVGHLVRPVAVVDFFAATAFAAHTVDPAATAAAQTDERVGADLRLPLRMLHGGFVRVEPVLSSQLTPEILK